MTTDVRGRPQDESEGPGQTLLTAIPTFEQGPLDPDIAGELDVWHTVERIARTLHLKEPDLESTLTAVLSTAVELIDTSCAAGLNLWERGVFTPQAVVGAEPPALDALQQRTGTGPCIDASRDQQIVYVADLRDDDRYPEFGELAVSLGIGAMFCVPLWIDDMRLGSLSLYFAALEDRRERDLRMAALIGVHAAAAIADAKRTDNLRRAISNRDLIGQAKGILMERHRVTADQAFAVLSTASQRTNRKLVQIAEGLVLTGEVPA
jgi:GAF domain-containing protein